MGIVGFREIGRIGNRAENGLGIRFLGDKVGWDSRDLGWDFRGFERGFL